MAEDERIARLAKHIGSEVRKEQHLLLTTDEVLNLRREGAMQLHAMCAEFVASVNRLLTPAVLELTPAEFAPEMFRENGTNLLQINAQGRIIQLAFESTREKFSTDKFLIPYILEGEVRAYNREMLERTQVLSQALFFSIENQRNAWHYFEWNHGKTGVFSSDDLVNLFERLV